MLKLRLPALALAIVALGAIPAPALADDDDDRGRADLDVLSSRADQVSGGDALVRVEARESLLDDLLVRLNGDDVTDAFEPEDGNLVGLVTGLELGRNRLELLREKPGRDRSLDRLTLKNHPHTGPMFSGPHQIPFVCKTIQAGLGEPLVDNQAGQGFRVLNPDGTIAGWSRNCSAQTRVDYQYRSSATNQFRALPADGSRPADMARTTLLDGREVDYVVRRERGTINRFIYSFAMLAPLAEAQAPQTGPDTSLWNKRLIYTFDGGVAIGRNQGTLVGSSSLYDIGLSKGYAIVNSSGTRTNTHYNLELGGETALMTKEEFVERYGLPLYTVGVGGSGGAIQQYVYGQNHPGLLDAGIPQYSYPDMVTQTIHIGDCELLEHYMDVTAGSNAKWRNWDDREWLEGLNASATWPNPYRGGAPGSTECVNGWRGLTPLALNPLFGTAGPGTERMDPAVMAAVHWTHWEDVKNIYGVGPDGYARQTWDNVGVQYGLKALKDGHITPEEFLDVNARAGSWKDPGEMVQEGRPFVPMGAFDFWSARNMRLSADNGVTPAPRRQGDLAAMRAAYNRGLYFDGDVDIPMIDWRHYLEEELDMHNSHQSFAARQRMLDHDGRASNQVIWFTDARPQRLFDQTPQAFAVIDEWMANIRRHPGRGVARNKPALATDRCFTTQGDPIASGRNVWDGILDDDSPGACTEEFPLHSTSRIVAGGPLRGGVYKCALQSVDRAISRGLYGTWRPSSDEVARLKQIFPTGVCDYSREDVGRP
jgi:Tannase-like family of unknown function (DUF6351)